MSMRYLCVATLMAAVAGSDKAGSHGLSYWRSLRKQLESRKQEVDGRVQTQIAANGLVQNEGNVVRKVQKRSARGSMFAGAQRTDRYSFHKGLNCSTGHGGADIDSEATMPMGKTLPECQKLCAKDDDCTCITFASSTGRCAKQRNCYTESCVPSSLADTYTQHTSLKVGGGSVPQAAFERSGGRECTTTDNATDIDTGSSAVEDLSVTQCLQRCLGNPSCGCVRYERYYQSECFLKQNCPKPTFCTRSNRYDTYVKV